MEICEYKTYKSSSTPSNLIKRKSTSVFLLTVLSATNPSTAGFFISKSFKQCYFNGLSTTISSTTVLYLLLPFTLPQIQHLINNLLNKKYEYKSPQFFYCVTENCNIKWKLRWDKSHQHYFFLYLFLISAFQQTGKSYFYKYLSNCCSRSELLIWYAVCFQLINSNGDWTKASGIFLFSN